LTALTAGSRSGRFAPDRPSGAQGGQGVVEYGLILAIMLIVCVVALIFFGDQLSSILDFIASRV
jgi:Flp pilus assembly pilin Flp